MTKRILSGMRPTGKLHLGHFVGALENWVALQNERLPNGEPAYQNFHLIADYHSLTTNLDTSHLYEYAIEMVIDWLACGIDPERSPVFRQSQVKEHTELFLIFSMLITTSRLERNPSLKEQVRDLALETVVYGHLGYPVLQAADILLYKGEVVPVGEDQLPHIEITREIARRFNQQYPKPDGSAVFPEPEGKLTRFSRLVGLDGKAKMSKSLGNTILLSDPPDEVMKKMRTAVTDPQKVRKGDPGNPDICTVFAYHKKFTDAAQTAEIDRDCRSGTLGCVECKKRCADSISRFLEPILERRASLAAQPERVRDILHDGEARARKVAQATMQEVRETMKLG
ncbi:MAG: tryptophan--tRNA ligase [Chloroherpetonaceae bacterium]|nr:tryptophan--tRNA ligase [Chloroherpetonaceae bacterium]MCS7210418.1 tryptophan--tRNA ligase [Chloroherpetonaceae bacterium]MDW8019475.1 tryptophan--tRNA ligase [Chloroherpetonaceae bacterium]MDW8465583.1 tryptophan--tRNA ligase [Chloroherpetonaceae bacterium]